MNAEWAGREVPSASGDPRSLNVAHFHIDAAPTRGPSLRRIPEELKTLILCSNRDEFLDRPTQKARWHTFEPIHGSEASKDPGKEEVAVPLEDVPEDERGKVLSGRDAAAGGTWFGVTREGRVALLTNITEPRAVYATTRGELASSWLLSEGSLDGFTFNLTSQHRWKSYAGFNMLLLEPKWSTSNVLSYVGEYATNSGGGGPLTARSLLDEEVAFVGGITNGIESLNGRTWPKLVDGRKKFSEALAELEKDASAEQIVERLSEILSLHASEPITQRSDLRNTIRVEPFMLPNTSASGLTKMYGTRLHTFLLVKRTGEVTFVERDAWMQGGGGGEGELGSKDNDRVFRFVVGPDGK
ncbi:hypothetical protein FRB90_003098 [Tulasnella sp. 427]|nr:hypothetical protein FRB90_003098 [Tulasnella sp. 427]